jgi:hypothetical protein
MKWFAMDASEIALTSNDLLSLFTANKICFDRLYAFHAPAPG